MSRSVVGVRVGGGCDWVGAGHVGACVGFCVCINDSEEVRVGGGCVVVRVGSGCRWWVSVVDVWVWFVCSYSMCVAKLCVLYVGLCYVGM